MRDVGDEPRARAELGGKVIVPPDPAVLDGRIAVITDPAGAPLGLMQWDEDAGEGN